MPKSKSKARPRATSASESPVESLQQKADALFRIAGECCRQRRRYSRLVERETSEVEQAGALRMVGVCDELLFAAAADYETGAPTEGEGAVPSEGWRRRANALWLASREFERRREQSDTVSTRLTSHDHTMLSELHLEYDLAASALLGVQHAVEAYRKVRPEADLGYVAVKG